MTGSGYFSVTVIGNPNKKQLRGEKGLFWFTVPKQMRKSSGSSMKKTDYISSAWGGWGWGDRA